MGVPPTCSGSRVSTPCTGKSTEATGTTNSRTTGTPAQTSDSLKVSSTSNHPGSGTLALSASSPSPASLSTPSTTPTTPSIPTSTSSVITSPTLPASDRNTGSPPHPIGSSSWTTLSQSNTTSVTDTLTGRNQSIGSGSTVSASAMSLSTTPSTLATRESSAGATDAASRSKNPIRKSNHTGAIAGGVLGGLALLIALLAGLAMLRRKRRASRTAPSAEFMHMARSGGTNARVGGGTTPTFDQDGSVGSCSDDPPPGPPFTEGGFYGYSDPVLEKVWEAAEMREQYRRRSESYATALEFKLGDDESKGHGSESDDSEEKGDSDDIFAFSL
ncbi:hypothetical protein FKP32DRAFT_620100 [Trametes sanguinea]|nr:hypothetical protein FKP32DRAFT_620100 [Trametes sanguinea]